jgi:hypothetical protein
MKTHCGITSENPRTAASVSINKLSLRRCSVPAGYCLTLLVCKNCIYVVITLNMEKIKYEE